MSEHAVLSPSSAHRWVLCPGSIVLEKNEPNVDSEYAAEGTLAHSIAAAWLMRIPHPDPLPDGMAEQLDKYVSYVRKLAEGNNLLVEQRLSIEHVTGEKGACGTSDAVVISQDGETITIVDLKYGMGVKVEAEENLQLILYAAGALKQFDMLGDFKFVKMVVHQPRLDHVSEWEVPVETLTPFLNKVVDASVSVSMAMKSNSLADYLVPGDKQCRFCRAKANCPTLAAVTAKATGADFDNLEQTELPEPDTSTLSEKMSKVEIIEQWCKAIRGKVEAELLIGHAVSGYKLVEGKRGNRDWRDDDEAEDLLKRMRLKQDEIYSFKLLSPTQVLKKIKDNPLKTEKVEELIVQRQGKPSVAPVSDPRPALTIDPAADFKQIEGD